MRDSTTRPESSLGEALVAAPLDSPMILGITTCIGSIALMQATSLNQMWGMWAEECPSKQSTRRKGPAHAMKSLICQGFPHPPSTLFVGGASMRQDTCSIPSPLGDLSANRRLACNLLHLIRVLGHPLTNIISLSAIPSKFKTPFVLHAVVASETCNSPATGEAGDRSRRRHLHSFTFRFW